MTEKFYAATLAVLATISVLALGAFALDYGTMTQGRGAIAYGGPAVILA